MEFGTREMPPKKGSGSQPLGRRDATGPQSGEVLQGRYMILGTLGVGGFSSVYRARDLRFPSVTRLCAVKEMVISTDDPEMRQLTIKSFEREAGMLATLNHPAIPDIYDYFTDGNRSYLVLEFVPGQNLQQWLDEAAATGFLPEEQTLGKFVSSVSTDGLYDTHVFPVCASDQTSFLHGRVHVEVACMTPRSRGAVHISSAAPQAHPHIDHGYLNDTANPDGSSHDLAVLRDGLVHAERLLQHPRLAQVLGERLTDMSTDSAIRDTVTHYYHPVGTCAMGDGPLAVCDADGRVHGVPGVVVADVCLMPQIPRGNTNLPAVMIGERIALTL